MIVNMISSKYKQSGYDYLYYITHIGNVINILERGIYSKNIIKDNNISHFDLSNHEVQNIRDQLFIGDHINLHDFVNLFFNPRNSMLFNLMCNNDHSIICVLVIDVSVLDEPETFVSDGIAAKSITRAVDVKEGLQLLNYEEIFRRDWNDPSEAVKDYKRNKVSAEALIKNTVYPNKILKILVPDENAKTKLIQFNVNIPIIIEPDVFFEV